MKHFLTLVFAAACFLTLVGVYGQEDGKDMVLARVNSSIITRRDAEKFLAVTGDIKRAERNYYGAELEKQKAELLKGALGFMIKEAVVQINAEWEGIRLDENDRAKIEKRFQGYISQFGNEANCELVLKEHGATTKDVRDRLARGILEEKYVRKKVGAGELVTPREVREYYEVNKSAFGKTFTIRQIVVKHGRGLRRREDAFKLIGQIRETVLSGEHFGSLARKYSEGPRREEGGLWEPVAISDFRENIARAIASLRQGEVSGIIEREGQFLLVKVETRSGPYEPFEEVLSGIKQEIGNVRRQRQLQKIARELYSSVEIELLLDGVKLADICPSYLQVEGEEVQETVEEISP
jgi:peptidyl-prolyl cis-trans isomerase SurA